MGEQYTEYALIFRTQGAGASWIDSEDALLYEMYPQSSRSDILAALPHRSWISIRFPAMALKIKRIGKPRETGNTLPTLSLMDISIMREYHISEAQIVEGQRVWWAIVDTVKQEGLFGS